MVDPGMNSRDLVAAAASVAGRAAARLAAAEHELGTARAEYHQAVRRLHLAGATVREVAQALGISHQRVQQIVRASGGSWWSRAWKRRAGDVPGPCSFCGRSHVEVDKLIAGPRVFICDACVRTAGGALRGTAATPPQAGDARFARVPLPDARATCSFCGRPPADDRPIAESRRARVCGACLDACREILAGSSP